MATKTQQCQMCNRGLQSFSIPAMPEKKETYTIVKSSQAMLQFQKRYRNPPL